MNESLNKKELEGKIDQYVNGRLSAREVDELWSELIQHDDHVDYLKSVANLKAVIEQRRESTKVKERKYWYYAAAAVVVLLIAVLGVINFSTQSPTVKPIAGIELNYYRSADGSLSINNEAGIIRNAITLATEGKIEKAIALLEGELKSATKPLWIAKLSLNLGSLYYNQGHYSQAIRHYEAVISNKAHIDVLMLEKAYWYTGNAYFHMDQLSRARANIENAYDLNGAYRRVTKRYLNALSAR